MQAVLPNYLRDAKCRWKWPKNFPECDRAKDLIETIQKAMDENWPDKLEELYE
jgi:hypothetical protein